MDRNRVKENKTNKKNQNTIIRCFFVEEGKQIRVDFDEQFHTNKHTVYRERDIVKIEKGQSSKMSHLVKYDRETTVVN